MIVRSKCTLNDASEMREVVFDIEIELPDKTNVEQAEASAVTLLGAVSDQAQRWCAQQDDDDREEWQEA